MALDFPGAHRVGIFRPGAPLVLSALQNRLPKWNLWAGSRLSFRRAGKGRKAMLVERGLRVMKVEVVGDAYAIASNYLRRTGAIADPFVTNDRLLEIIVEMFQRGEFNKIRLANKAIAKFESTELV
jgi:hypothetical protein